MRVGQTSAAMREVFRGGWGDVDGGVRVVWVCWVGLFGWTRRWRVVVVLLSCGCRGEEGSERHFSISGRGDLGGVDGVCGDTGRALSWVPSPRTGRVCIRR